MKFIIPITEEAVKQTGARIDTPPLVSIKPEGLEEQSIIQAIVDIMQPSIENDDDLQVFFNILQDIFPLSRNSKSASSQYQDTKLVNAVRDQLNEDNIKETQEIMDKVGNYYIRRLMGTVGVDLSENTRNHNMRLALILKSEKCKKSWIRYKA